MAFQITMNLYNKSLFTVLKNLDVSVDDSKNPNIKILILSNDKTKARVKWYMDTFK